MSATGVKPDLHKIKVISQYAVPTNAKELKKFLGLANYYCKLIYNYATIAELLSILLRGHKRTISLDSFFSAGI